MFIAHSNCFKEDLPSVRNGIVIFTYSCQPLPRRLGISNIQSIFYWMMWLHRQTEAYLISHSGCSQYHFPVKEVCWTEVGSSSPSYGCLSARLTNPPWCCWYGGQWVCVRTMEPSLKTSLKPTSLLHSLMRSEWPAGCISSENAGRTVIINFRRVTRTSRTYLFPKQTFWTHCTWLKQYFPHWEWHQKPFCHRSALSKASVHGACMMMQMIRFMLWNSQCFLFCVCWTWG